MDTSTGDVYETRAAIDLAVKDGRIKDLSRLVQIPIEVLEGTKNMTRKERRTWYHENRKRLNLPRWGELAAEQK